MTAIADTERASERVSERAVVQREQESRHFYIIKKSVIDLSARRTESAIGKMEMIISTHRRVCAPCRICTRRE
jgi:hypothetical protein